MGRIKSLDRYQKGVLLVMLVMALIFAVIYPKTISRVGYRYNDAFLVLTEENGNTVYSGKIQGEQAEFMVSDDNTVVFNYGDKTYGPYTVKQDATAIPIRRNDWKQLMKLCVQESANGQSSTTERIICLGRFVLVKL